MSRTLMPWRYRPITILPIPSSRRRQIQRVRLDADRHLRPHRDHLADRDSRPRPQRHGSLEHEPGPRERSTHARGDNLPRTTRRRVEESTMTETPKQHQARIAKAHAASVPWTVRAGRLASPGRTATTLTARSPTSSRPTTNDYARGQAAPPYCGRGRGGQGRRDSMSANGVTLARVRDHRFAGQMAITCAVCDWRGLATNTTLAQHQTERHIDSASHLERLAEADDPSSRYCPSGSTHKGCMADYSCVTGARPSPASVHMVVSGGALERDNYNCRRKSALLAAGARIPPEASTVRTRPRGYPPVARAAFPSCQPWGPWARSLAVDAAPPRKVFTRNHDA